MITGYDGEGRKYYHPEPTDVGFIDISRGPVETNHSSVSLPIVLPERGGGGGGFYHRRNSCGYIPCSYRARPSGVFLVKVPLDTHSWASG